MKIELKKDTSHSFAKVEVGQVFQITHHKGNFNPGPFMKCSGKVSAVNLTNGLSFHWLEHFEVSTTVKTVKAKLVDD